MEARFANPDGTDIVLTDDNGQVFAVKPDDPRLAGVEVTAYTGLPFARWLDTLAFRRRFTAEERAAITLAASAAMDATPRDATLQVFLDDIAAAGRVDLDDPDIARVLDLLVAAGLIAAGRKDAILA